MIWIDTEDASGNKYGDGPITTASEWQHTRRLDDVNRRTFLQLFVIAFGSIWLPGVMRNAGMTTTPAVNGWGVGVPAQPIFEHGTWLRERTLAVLRPGCWAHWHALAPGEPYQPTGYMPMAYDDMYSQTVAAQRMAVYPSEKWLMLNEPERPEQGNMTPAQAVDFYEMFQSMAPVTLRWTSPGIAVNLSDYDGLAWLTAWQDEMHRRGHAMPHSWNIHMYPSGNLAACQRTWDRWQEWHSRRGEGKPVIISELCAMESDYRHQVEVMDWGRERLAAGNATAVLWYSAFHTAAGSYWPQSALTTIDAPNRRVLTTRLGEHWQTLNQ